jgi:threonine/homoserine/homoserine lactone efflux protein
MTTLTLFWIVFAIYIPALILPWPDFLITITNSLKHSREKWLYTILWLSSWYLTHIFYSLIWITVILSQSEIILIILKSIWAFYLIFLWYKIAFSKFWSINFKNKKIKKEISNFKAFKMWFFTSALNPKSMLFFLSIFTLVIRPETSNKIIFLLVTLIWLTYILWYFIVVFIFTQKKVQNIYNKLQKILNKIFWWILWLFGILILFSK